MPTPCTEAAFISLKPGIDIEGDAPGTEIWKETLETLSSQDGYQRCYYGRQLENPDILMLLVDWDSVDSHINFTKAPQYGPFKDKLFSIMTGVYVYHVIPIQFPPSILSQAPCIEFATCHGTEPGFIKNVEQFAGRMNAGKPDGFHGIAYGDVVEKIKKGGDSGEGDESSAVTLWLGWDSKEAHMRFRDSELFKEIIGFLRTGATGAEIFHVPFKAY